jgi:phosphate transport system permease protein
MVVIDLDPVDQHAAGAIHERLEAVEAAVGSSDPAADRPRRIRTFRRTDAVDVGVAALAAASMVGVLFTLLDWGGWLAPVVWWLALFLGTYRLIVGATQGPVVATDRTMTVLIGLGAGITVGALLWLVSYVFVKGLPELSPSFFTEDMSAVGPLDDGGGAYHAIIGTLQQVGIATAIAVPAAILTAIYLHEIKGRAAPVIRFFVDAMSGLPSIVAGLLVYSIWILQFGQGYSGAAAAAALTILMLPTITRTTEEILRTVPDTLREASFALGAPQWRVVLRVVVPTARSGLVTAAILGVARAIGETAPLLLTASYFSGVNTNPLEGQQASLPMFVYQLVRQPNENQINRAWTGALVLLITVLVLFLLARFIGERGRHKRGF